MLNKAREYFTIGQFAAIHGVTKKTLMWYDEMELVKPEAIGENGYRYYSYRQSSALETVRMLRELNISIPEIRAFMRDRSAARMERLLGEQLEALNARIARLKDMRRSLESRRQDMQALMNLDLNEIRVVEKPRGYLATVPVSHEMPDARDIERVIATARAHDVQRLHDAVYGSMISVEALRRGEYDDYAALYIELPHPASGAGIQLQPAGRYLRAYCRGAWENIPARYAEMFEHARAHGLSLCGYACETGINESVIDGFDEYITRIEIPIQG